MHSTNFTTQVLLPFTMIRSTNRFPFSFASEYSFHSLLIWFTDFYQFFVSSAHLKRNDSTIHLPISKFVTKYKIYPLFFLIAGNGQSHFITIFSISFCCPFSVCSFCLCCVFQLFAPFVCFHLPFFQYIFQQTLFPLNPTNLEPIILLSSCTPTFQTHFSYDAHLELEMKKWRHFVELHFHFKSNNNKKTGYSI